MFGLEIVMAAALVCGGDGGVQTVTLKANGGCQCGQKVVAGQNGVFKVDAKGLTELRQSKSGGKGNTQIVVTSRDGSSQQVKTLTLPSTGAHAYVWQDGKLRELPQTKVGTQGVKVVAPKNVRVRSVEGNDVILPKNVRVRSVDGGVQIVAPKNVRVRSIDGAGGGSGSGGGVQKLRVLPGGTILRLGEDREVVPLVKRSSSRAILL